MPETIGLKVTSYTEGAELIDVVLDVVRKEVENFDCLPGDIGLKTSKALCVQENRKPEGERMKKWLAYQNPSSAQAKEDNKLLKKIDGQTYTSLSSTVSVECKDADGSFKKEMETDEEGKFRVHLPSSISKHEKEIKGCQVRLVKSSEPYCAVASTASSSSIHLKSRKQGTGVFSAGFFTFKPLKQPDVCNQQPEEVESITRPQFFFFPPVFPSPPPAIGGVPLPPNPLQPPPLVPVPFPPNPLQPPSPPAFGFPPIPGFPSLIPVLQLTLHPIPV